MTRTMLTLAALLAFSTSAGAQVPRVVRVIESSYELDLTDVIFPTGQLGAVNVRTCATCARALHEVTTSTAYIVNAKQVPFADFLKVVDDRRKTSRPTFVGVYYDRQTKKVNRILLKY